ncbi:DUF4240 domain-containing protein [Nonomuraea sp. NPDC049152]|uniref:DUF4240 domain-containing protein n=1 Tax=Nonomuraea sp. NPDC049152 TaxID=3154350 RepID=UPI0033CAADB1
MDIDGFWDLIERSGRETDTRRARVAWLERHLSGLSAEEIVDYDTFWTITTNRACTWDMYALFCIVFDGPSTDGFEYFVNWLVSLGRETFEMVVDRPDRVVELPEVEHLRELQRSFFRGYRRTWRSEDGAFRLVRIALRRREIWPGEVYPGYEALGYVTFDPYLKVTGFETDHLGEAVRARGVIGKFPFVTVNDEPDGEEWDFGDEAEIARRLPLVARRYDSS